MKFKYIFILSFIFSLYAQAQINLDLREELETKLSPSQEKILDAADEFLQKREYLKALPLYDTLHKSIPNNIYLSYLLGTCYSFDAHLYTEAESLIVTAAGISQRFPDFDYFLGKAYEQNDKYDLAILHFEKYLKNPISSALRNEVSALLNSCKNAKIQSTKGVAIKINSVGKPINSVGSEYSPVLPADESFMVFTYRGPLSMGGKQSMPGRSDEKKGIYFEDVYIAYKDSSGKWKNPEPINSINTNGHDAVMSISNDGQKLFIYRNVSAGNGDIYLSKLIGKEWTKPEIIKGINSKSWEGSACLSPDESIIYFSSERPGGLGGRDLWFSIKLPDGTWGTPKNLGPSINTKFDEDAPFVHFDGKTLFFSSTGHNSIGGYDIFRSDLKKGAWSLPYNLGKPVNTPQDDKFYFVSPDGKRGYYSTEKAKGEGEQDIYMVEPGMFGKPTPLVLLKGKTSLDGIPCDANVTVITQKYKTDFAGTFNSNKQSGLYMINLPTGYEYEIKFSNGNSSAIRHISTALVDSFSTLEIDVDLNSRPLPEIKIDSSQILAEDLSIAGYSYSRLLEKNYNRNNDSLQFTVQIGAFRIIENFNYSALIGLPKVRRQEYSDGITRFLIGSLKNIGDAEELLKKAIHNGLKDSFIFPVYNGEKKTFKELIEKKILDY